ncbi:MAG: hypothetical protein QOE87_3343 [Gaiellales bacterium]|nr:hypothetical protein [Gaiellales bacterium]
MIEIAIPAIGVAMTEATVVEWLKRPGETVAADEPIVEIETDKASTELESPRPGTLGAHLAAAGDVVGVGTVIVRVLEAGETEPAAATAAAIDVPQAVAGGEAPAATAPEPDAPAGGEPRYRLSPRARRIAAEQAAAEAAAPAAPADAQPDGFRRLIAATTLEAWQTIPHFAVTRTIAAEPLSGALAQARVRSEVRITITDLLLRALAHALAATGEDGDVALAVATSRGVVNPVLANVLAVPLPELARDRAAAVERARAGRLAPQDLGAATTTLSNLGTAEVDHFTGIVTPGQRTLLTVGAIAARPVVRNGSLAVGMTFQTTINADHRVLDGSDAAALLGAFAAAVGDGAVLLGEWGESA